MSTYVGSKPVPLSQEQIETSVYQQNHKYFFLIKTLDYTRVKQKVGIFWYYYIKYWIQISIVTYQALPMFIKI